MSSKGRGRFIFWAAKVDWIDNPLWKLVLIVVADHCDENGRCYPSLATITRLAGCSRASVKRALNGLEQLGLITRHRRTKGGEKISTLYEVMLSEYPGSQGASVGSQGTEDGSQGAIEGPTEVPTESQKKPPCNPPKGDDSFDRFWAMYPRRTAKGAAEKAWKAACKRVDPDMLIALITKDLERRDREREWQDKKFIPHPSTYLNQRRWEDESVRRGISDVIEDTNRQMRRIDWSKDPFALPSLDKETTE